MAGPHGELKTSSRGIRDAATVLPLAATCLLMPPIILIFATPAFVAGVPLIIVYIFGIWALTVVASFVVARALQREELTAGTDDTRLGRGDGLDGMDDA